MIHKETKLSEAVRKMPKLSHWPDRNQEFDIAKSDVAKWLCSQPEVMSSVVEAARRQKLIRFDKGTLLWKGTHDEAIQWTGDNKHSIIKFIEDRGDSVGKLIHVRLLEIRTENSKLKLAKTDWVVVDSYEPIQFKVVPDEEYETSDEGDL